MLGGVLDLAGHAFRFLDPQQLAGDERLVLDSNYLAVTGACLMVARRKYEESAASTRRSLCRTTTSTYA